MGEIGGSLITAYGLGLIVVFIILKMFYKPLKFLIKILINSIFGGIVLFVLNLVGSNIGVGVGINAFTALVTGVLGAPGLSLLLLLQVVLNA